MRGAAVPKRDGDRLTARAARAGVAERLRIAGPEYWLLAAFVATGTNLLDFAVVPAPGTGLALGLAALAAGRRRR